MKEFHWVKFLVFVGLLVFFAIVIETIREDYFPEKTITQYYNLLRDKSKILETEYISQEQLKDLESCGDDYICFKKYYYNYNMEHTLKKSFSNLSLLLAQYPKYTDYCHQITHGLGNSELEKQGGDMGKALEIFDTGKYFTNIATCGSGYFHGLVEEAVKEIKDKDELVTKFTDMCNDSTVKEIAGSDCIHGLGHATYIQTEYNTEDSLYVCDKVTNNDYDKFNCYTGIFMEANLDLPQILSIEKTGDTFNFKMCNLLEDELQKRACYFETAMQFRTFIKDKNDYSQMTKLCQTITDKNYRMACVKNVAIRSIIDTGNNNFDGMCLQKGLSNDEQILCGAIFAHRIALSITGTKNDLYYKYGNDMCKNLKASQEVKCQNVLKNNPHSLYIVTDKDFNL